MTAHNISNGLCLACMGQCELIPVRRLCKQTEQDLEVIRQRRRASEAMRRIALHHLRVGQR